MITEEMKELSILLIDCGFIAKKAWIERTLIVGQPSNTRPEETMDFFTTLDAELDERLIEGIRARLDVTRFMTEEGAQLPERNQEGDVRAVIDSLDGSSNFATYRPDFGISVAIEKNGIPMVAGIITPIRGELLIASAKEGTYLFLFYGKTQSETIKAIEQNESIKITPQSFALSNKKKRLSPLETSRIYVHTGKRRNFELSAQDPWNTIYAKLANPGCTFCCSVALVEVALGKLDGAVIGFQNHWDYAAGRLLIQEAGGYFEVWDCKWTHILSDEELAFANATKDEKGDEWLAHVIAAGREELLTVLREHFVV